MAGELSLKTPATGLVTLSPANTATDKTITIPATTGTVVIQDGTNTTTVNNLAYTGTLTGGTGVINIGSGQVYKDASGNVGIGTSSPINTFGKSIHLYNDANTGTVASNTFLFVESANRNSVIELSGSASATNAINFSDTPGTAVAGIACSIADQNIFFRTGGTTERMRLDASGNLGLGVTPSAWNTFTALQVKDISLASFTNGDTRLSSNAFYQSGWKYINTRPAVQYLQDSANGVHAWFTAPSGTAGNAISFNQAMTLDASGKLILGTTISNISPGTMTLLSSYGLEWYWTTGASYANIFNQTSSAALVLASGYQRGPSSEVYKSSTGAAWAKSAISVEYGNVRFFTNPETTIAVGSDVTPTERARIDSAGNLLVGTTNANPGYGNTAVGVKVSNSMSNFSASTVDWVITVNQNSNDGSNRYLIGFRNANVNVGNITGNGTSVAYNTSSDYRLKENVQPMQNALATVAALKPCTYTWKSNGNAGQGFIAHELQAVVPDAVTGEKDAVDEDGNPKYQGVDTSFLVATLTAAIQELTARLEVLENK